MSKKKSILDNGKRQRISDRVLILTLFVQILLLVNQSIGIYAVAAQSMQASIVEPTGEALEVHIGTDTGRLNLVEKLIKQVRDWTSSYFVGGSQAQNATTGITITVTGSNVASTAYVDYYIKAVPQSGGNSYNFLAGNGTNLQVGGSALQLSNQTSIENHLTAMGLSTTASHTIDYYVYVKATVTGAVSGDTLTSEITYTKFDTVSYQYGSQVTLTKYCSNAGDGYVYGTISTLYNTQDYLRAGDSSSTSSYYDYHTFTNFAGVTVPQGATIVWAELMVWCNVGTTTNGPIYVYAEDADDPANVGSKADYYSRVMTSANVTWPAEAWNTGWSYYVPGEPLRDVIQEVVDRPGYAGNRLQLFYREASGWGGVVTRKSFYSYEGGGQASGPRLRVCYLSYAASWYPLPPLSLADLPITLNVVAMCVLIGATAYTLQSRRRKR